MVKFKVTYTAVYEANPKHYNTEDLDVMLEIDRQNFVYDPGMMFGLGEETITVEKDTSNV